MSIEAQPMWQLIEQCARALTEAGNTPFTRGDIIECVKQRAPKAKSGSLNPVIQGITDNLQGGAPGATGKDILHSVGRGKFVLRSETDSDGIKSPRGDLEPDQCRMGNGSTAVWAHAMPEREEGLRDEIVQLLRPRLSDAGCVVEAEGSVTYRLPDGTMLRHASDILIHGPGAERQVSIELKYKSAVTDQFKCRSYDAAHMKEQHGEAILTIMVFARAGSGISIERARSICHAFDRFYGDNAPRFLDTGGVDDLVADIRQFLL